MYLSPPRIHAWVPSQAIVEYRDEFIAFRWITIAFSFEQTETNRWCKWYESNVYERWWRQKDGNFFDKSDKKLFNIHWLKEKTSSMVTRLKGIEEIQTKIRSTTTQVQAVRYGKREKIERMFEPKASSMSIKVKWKTSIKRAQSFLSSKNEEERIIHPCFCCCGSFAFHVFFICKSLFCQPLLICCFCRNQINGLRTDGITVIHIRWQRKTIKQKNADAIDDDESEKFISTQCYRDKHRACLCQETKRKRNKMENCQYRQETNASEIHLVPRWSQ